MGRPGTRVQEGRSWASLDNRGTGTIWDHLGRLTLEEQQIYFDANETPEALKSEGRSSNEIEQLSWSWTQK